MKALIIGTRGSDLALWQSRHVQAQLAKAHPTEPASILRTIVTSGDRSQAERLVGKLEKGFFTKELEEELLRGDIDLAVHSLKDLPTKPPVGLKIGAILMRANCHDLLIVNGALADVNDPRHLPLVTGSTVGASSIRRESLLKQFAPQAKAVPLRGNVPTRLKKLREANQGEKDKSTLSAILLASAGIERLGLDLSGLKVFALNPQWWQPAPGQGAIAVQCRANDQDLLHMLSAIHHHPTASAVDLERAFLQALEGGCTTPFGCYATHDQVFLGLASPQGWQTLLRPRAQAESDIVGCLTQLQQANRTNYDSLDWLYRPQ